MQIRHTRHGAHAALAGTWARRESSLSHSGGVKSEQVGGEQAAPRNMREGWEARRPPWVRGGFDPAARDAPSCCVAAPAATGLRLQRTLPLRRACSGCPVETGSSAGALAVRASGSRSRSLTDACRSTPSNLGRAQ